jgi:multidrug resistance efflux pump
MHGGAAVSRVLHLLAAATVVAQLACSGGDAGLEVPAQPMVTELGVLEPRVLLSGELQAVGSIEITVPRTPTWEMEIRWLREDGEQVTAGDKVVEFDNTAFVADLDARRNAVDIAEQALLKQRAEAEAARLEAEMALAKARLAVETARLRTAVPSALISRREAATRQLELERAELELEKVEQEHEMTVAGGRADLAVREIELASARRRLQAAERAIDDLVMTAPRDGVIVIANHFREDRKLQVGDTVWVGLTVARLPELSRMKVDARLSDVDDGLIAPGMAARCTLDAFPDLELAGTVSQISPVAQEVSRRSLRRAFAVDVLLDGSDPDRLRPGMSVKVEVPLASCDQALLAPRAALDLSGDSARLCLAGGGGIEVVLGSCSAQRCVVEGELQPGLELRPVEAPW